MLEQLRTHIERERERFDVPGCAVAVVAEGKVLLSEGFGRRNLGGDALTSQTLLPIGSSTKTFTAALCASLVDEGLIELDQPVRELLPGFRLQDPTATELLTVRDCLAHRSGLPRHDWLWYAGEGRISRDEMIAALAHLPPTRPFRQTWQYNNLLYTTIGHVAGRLTGDSYEEAVQRRVLDPLGMSRTNFRVADLEPDDDHSRPHVLNADGVVEEVPFAHLDLIGPAGCINSCADDLAPWLLTLLGQGHDGSEPLLSTAVLEELQRPAMPLPPGALVSAGLAVGYGLGVVVEDYRGHRVLHHGGNIDGFSSQVAVVPGAGIGVAILTNLGATRLRDALPFVLFDALLGLEPRDHGGGHHEKAQALRAGAAQARAARSSNAKQLPAVRDLADYVGCYSHRGYGDVEVVLRDGALRGSYGHLSGDLEHRHLEVFDLVICANGEQLRFPLRFGHDLDAEVDALHLQLEPMLPPQPFLRRPDESALTDDLLERLSGRYALGVVEIRISRRGRKQLVLAVDAGAARPLRYVKERTFALDGSPVTFDDDGRLATDLGEFVRQAG